MDHFRVVVHVQDENKERSTKESGSSSESVLRIESAKKLVTVGDTGGGFEKKETSGMKIFILTPP